MLRHDEFSQSFLKLHGFDTIWKQFWLWMPFKVSCNYTDMIVKENTELFDLKLQELVTENQELKSLVYNSLDQINDMREHNKSLSSRIFELESLLEKKEVPNLIDF